jgi:hypothetical protein
MLRNNAMKIQIPQTFSPILTNVVFLTLGKTRDIWHPNLNFAAHRKNSSLKPTNLGLGYLPLEVNVY